MNDDDNDHNEGASSGSSAGALTRVRSLADIRSVDDLSRRDAMALVETYLADVPLGEFLAEDAAPYAAFLTALSAGAWFFAPGMLNFFVLPVAIGTCAGLFGMWRGRSLLAVRRQLKEADVGRRARKKIVGKLQRIAFPYLPSARDKRPSPDLVLRHLIGERVDEKDEVGNQPAPIDRQALLAEARDRTVELEVAGGPRGYRYGGWLMIVVAASLTALDVSQGSWWTLANGMIYTAAGGTFLWLAERATNAPLLAAGAPKPERKRLLALIKKLRRSKPIRKLKKKERAAAICAALAAEEPLRLG